MPQALGKPREGRDLDGDAATFEAYYDTALNITWLADANFAQTSGYDADGYMSWDAVKTWATQLNINGFTGWRLPDVKPENGSNFELDEDFGFNITSTQSELAHLYNVTLGNKSNYELLGAYQPDFGLQNSGPFRNLQSFDHWFGVEYAPLSDYAWGFFTINGGQDYYRKYFEFSAWAVRTGDVAAAVPEPETYALALAGLAALAAARKRRQP